MRVATWNVNSIKARLPMVLDVLRDMACDVVCLQEIKCETDAFPHLEIEELGYNCAVHGQKSYNGVALLSRFPIEDIRKGLPGNGDDDQARYIEALVMSDRPVRVGGLYLPNGNPAPGDKFDYKLGWMTHLADHAKTLLSQEEAFVLCGDYNCIPHDSDCWDIDVWHDDALAARWERLFQVRRVVTGALEVERREKRIGASLEAAPRVHITDPDLFEAFEGEDPAELFITSGAVLVEAPAPAGSFTLEDVAHVAVVPALAEGVKCARSWKYFDPAAADPAYPGITPRDAAAVRAWDANAAGDA